MVLIGRQAVDHARPAIAHVDRYGFGISVWHPEMAVAEVRYGSREDICRNCGRATDVVFSLVAAVGKGKRYK